MNNKIHTTSQRPNRRAAMLAGCASFALLLMAPAAGFAHAPRAAGPALISPSFLLAPVERELQKATAESVTLAEIYRRHVHSTDEAATFFRSPAFLRLGLAGQRQLLDQAVALDPVAFLEQTEFLPLSLRQEYRRRACAGAADQGASPVTTTELVASN